MAKRILAILLLLALVCCLFGCSNDGAPDGMFSATLDGEPFILYVPDGWMDNTSSGISSAYFSANEKTGVSAKYYTAESSDTTLEEYVASVIDDYSKTNDMFDMESNEPDVLGGVDAREIIYTVRFEGKVFKFRQLFVKYLGDFVVLSFCSPLDTFEDRGEMFDMIADAFVLCEKGETVNDCVTDKKTPDGMKIASGDNVQYRLYVPVSWVCNSESGKSEAYFPESGKPNVTVTAYSPDSTMTIEEYFAECEEEYKEKLDGYEFISAENRSVAEIEARSYTYSVSVGEHDLRIMQTVFIYNELVYSFTYTALDVSFDAHIEDVNSMLDAFIFR